MQQNHVCLVQCPAWGLSVPQNIAMLSSLVKREGGTVDIFDINIELNLSTQNDKYLQSTWKNPLLETVWREIGFVKELFSRYAILINNFIEAIVASPGLLVCFSLQHPSKLFSIYLIGMIKARAPHKIIVCGGPLCFKPVEGNSLLKEHGHIDALCYTDAETTFPHFLREFFAKGYLQPTAGFIVRIQSNLQDLGKPQTMADLENTPFADYSQLTLAKYYPPTMPIMTSRGCINKCSYCNEPALWGKYRSKSPERIIQEYLFQKTNYPYFKNMFFTDSLLNANMRNFELLCDLLILNNNELLWTSQSMIRKEMTQEVMTKARRAGCTDMIYGLESGSNAVLKLMHKHYSQAVAEKVIKNTYSAGISPHVNIIVGYPGENLLHFFETLFFLDKIQRKYKTSFSIGICGISKDSYIYTHQNELGIILNKDWTWHLKNRSNTPAIRKHRYLFMQKYLNISGRKKPNILHWLKKILLIGCFLLTSC